MSEINTGESAQGQPAPGGWAAPQQPVYAAPGQLMAAGQAPYAGPVGKVRGTGVSILLAIVTFGIYPIVWYFLVHEEMKRHSNDGIGGGLALVLAILVSIAMPFITSSQVGSLYARRGLQRPVSGATGLWYVPGAVIVVGPLVWFVKTNGAINDYWRALGAR